MRSVGFVFPGQGSQSVGMLDSLSQRFSLVRDTVDEASSRLDYSLWELIHQGPADKLNETEFTQVAMLVADVAIYRVIHSINVVRPQMMAGHSLGEYAALVCSGALDFLDAVDLVRQRGQLMQQHVPLGLGAMAAVVGLSDEQVLALCEEATQSQQSVMPANYNAIGQVVVAGHREAVDRVILLSEEAGARLAKKIPVSVPCHCDLLKPASHVFFEKLSNVSFSEPSCPVLSNVEAKPYESAKSIPALLSEQLYRPVRWVETIQYMKASAIDSIVESGPGQVLSGLIKRIDRQIQVYRIDELLKWSEE